MSFATLLHALKIPGGIVKSNTFGGDVKHFEIGLAEPNHSAILNQDHESLSFMSTGKYTLSYRSPTQVTMEIQAKFYGIATSTLSDEDIITNIDGLGRDYAMFVATSPTAAAKSGRSKASLWDDDAAHAL